MQELRREKFKVYFPELDRSINRLLPVVHEMSMQGFDLVFVDVELSIRHGKPSGRALGRGLYFTCLIYVEDRQEYIVGGVRYKLDKMVSILRKTNKANTSFIKDFVRERLLNERT